MLTVEGLQAGYDRVPVLRGIDFRVGKGEFIGVLGHNGMGKTTLMKSLMGFLPTSGKIELDGRRVERLAPHRRSLLGVGYVPQGRGIFPQLSVLDNLRMGLVMHRLPELDTLKRVLADFPRLKPLLERRGGQLSGGEQQLLALARCLAGRPRLILLDEPTEGIQPSIVEEMIELLRRLRENQGLTVILVEQDLDFITALSDRVLLLQKGVIAHESDPHALHGVDLFHGVRHGAPTPAPNTLESAPEPLPSGVSYMTVRRPTASQLRAIVEDFGMTLTDEAIQQYLALMEPTLQAYDRVDALPDNLPPVSYPRTPGYRPDPQDNPLNAWYVKAEVRGAPRGPLSGRTVVLKDNVCLAGVPMMNGASTLEGYTPDVDATIVTRILDAGATIVGKAHCEYFCLSGGSHTNATGPVHNPHKHGYSAGGSSSGSGALVGAGEVEMAIGGDQGGSIRIPASFCGCVGMKPTHGLVPYTGVMPIEITIDHVGPITRTVADNALLLEVLAGEDGLDPRQYAPRVERYTAALGRGVRGMRIGVVEEGLGLPVSEPAVDAKVREVAERFRELGAVVESVSIPMHRDGPAIWTPIALEGLTDLMMHGNGFGTNWKGLYVTSLLDAHSAWRSRADELSDSLKISMFAGQYFQKHYRGHFYAKAQNLSRRLRGAYDEALGKYDLLLMPTLPMKATPLPAPGAGLAEVIQRAFEMIPNTAPFDATGHPAISVPCGVVEGLPVGLMLVGRHWGEAGVYQAAEAFERSEDWRNSN